jgi:hypothetical protein
MRLLENPLTLFPCVVRQVALQKVEGLNSLVLQLRKLFLSDKGVMGLADGDIPFRALNKDTYHIITEIRNMLQGYASCTERS